MIETMINTPAQWLDASGPDADIVVSSQCRLVRNLADYPFPEQCTEEEKNQIENRILDALHNLQLMPNSQYYPLTELDELEAQFLVECELITPELINGVGSRGVYFNEDQCTSISINDANHLTLCAHASGQQLQDTYTALSIIDDTLASVLDMSFSEKYGYMTTQLIDVGTGLRASAILHLPALTMLNTIQSINTDQNIHPLYPQQNIATGEFYRISNPGCLGLSELEIIYHLVQAIGEIVTQERDARIQLNDTHPEQLEDRIQRALGLSRSARLLAFDEGIGVLSSIRLGIANGLLKNVSLKTINQIFMDAHDAHLRLNCGEPCDEIQCNTMRAELFSKQFADNL